MLFIDPKKALPKFSTPKKVQQKVSNPQKGSEQEFRTQERASYLSDNKYPPSYCHSIWTRYAQSNVRKSN